MKLGIVNNKGGVLKTTLATNLAASLSMDMKRVAILDLDGQGNVIATFGQNPSSLEYAVTDFLNGSVNLNEILIEKGKYLHIIPGNDNLNYFDLMVKSGQISQSTLKLLINKLNQEYDYVIIDTPPSMSIVVATTLSVVDAAVIPFEPDQYATLGLKRVINAAKDFKTVSNLNMKIIAVPTKVNIRVGVHKDIIEKIKPKLKQQDVYVTTNYISSTTKSAASVAYERVPIVMSNIISKFQEEYHNLKREILDYIVLNKEYFNPIDLNNNLLT